MVSDRKSSGEKDEDDDSEDDHKKEEPEEDDDDDDTPMPDEMTAPPPGTMSALSDFQHSFESELRQPARNLVLKDLMIVFDPSTIYGNRLAFQKGLMVTVA